MCRGAAPAINPISTHSFSLYDVWYQSELTDKPSYDFYCPLKNLFSRDILVIGCRLCLMIRYTEKTTHDIDIIHFCIVNVDTNECRVWCVVGGEWGKNCWNFNWHSYNKLVFELNLKWQLAGGNLKWDYNWHFRTLLLFNRQLIHGVIFFRECIECRVHRKEGVFPYLLGGSQLLFILVCR